MVAWRLTLVAADATELDSPQTRVPVTFPILNRAGKQAALLAVVLVAGVLWVAIFGPPHESALTIARQEPWMAVAVVSAALVLLNLVLVARERVLRNPGPKTAFARATFWAGMISSLSLLTGFLLGWLALLLAPVGVLTGLGTIAAELKNRSGHNPGNLVGLGLCLAAIAFLLA